MQKAWAGVDFRGLRPQKVWPRRPRLGGAMRRTAPGGFLPVKAARGCNTVAGTYFRGSGACTQYDPEVILGAKTLDPKGDAYSGS